MILGGKLYMATRRYTFRLYPNKAQEKSLFAARRIHAYLYNACIADRRYQWRSDRTQVSYFEQQNCLPEFKKEWPEFAVYHSQSLQSTVKRVDLAYGAFFQGLRKLPKFKSIRNYSGWTYPAKSGWKVNSNGKHGTLKLNDLGITLRMRGQAKKWGTPTTLTVVYKPRKNQWFASITVNIPEKKPQFGSLDDLKYQEIVAYDLGTQTALTLYNGKDFTEIVNPRFTKTSEQKIQEKSVALRRKRAPNKKQKIKASNRWKKNRKQVSLLQRKVANQRKDWQHKVTSDIASRHDEREAKNSGVLIQYY